MFITVHHSSSQFITYLFGSSFSPLTKNNEHRSALVMIETFFKILWQSERTSRSLQMSFTNSDINSRSSRAINSWRVFPGGGPLDSFEPSVPGIGKNVGVPSIVVDTIGRRQPRSNSDALNK